MKTAQELRLKEAKLQLYTLSKTLETKELTEKEKKKVEATKKWLTDNFDISEVFRKQHQTMKITQRLVARDGGTNLITLEDGRKFRLDGRISSPTRGKWFDDSDNEVSSELSDQLKDALYNHLIQL